MKKTITTFILILITFVVYGQRPQRFQDGIYADANSVSYTVSGETEEGLPAVINVGPMEFKHYTNGYFAEIPYEVYLSLTPTEQIELERKVKKALQKVLGGKRYKVYEVHLWKNKIPALEELEVVQMQLLASQAPTYYIPGNKPFIEVKVSDVVKEAEYEKLKEMSRRAIVEDYLNF